MGKVANTGVGIIPKKSAQLDPCMVSLETMR